MPKNSSIRRILVLGSGPIVIGQACEFDYSGTQAIRALRDEGYEVLLINSNPATIMTDPELADRTYIEPLTISAVTQILEIEKPDALLPTMGGQTALNLAVELAECGVLDRLGIQLLGANLTSIKKAEDRELFKQTMAAIGVDTARSRQVHTVEEGLAALKEIGLPLILRPSFTLGGEGGGIAHSEAEFLSILERGLFLSPTQTVLIEESLVGWKEFELEVVRDRKDNVIIVCSIENLDPMGIHTGDSITVAPAQTLTDREYQNLRDLSKKIIRAIGVETGGSNIQFAVNPKDGRTVVIEMNPRVSRSSALASKATGFPIAKVAAKLAVGYTLDELKNDITKTTPASFEPSIDYVVTKIPRFDFQKFTATPPLLGTQMKSVGESMALGLCFTESFLKALSGMENGRTYLAPTEFDRTPHKLDSELDALLTQPLWTRLFYVASAFRRGYSVDKLQKLTGIDSWFLIQIRKIIDAQNWIVENRQTLSDWTPHQWRELKRLGLSDFEIEMFSGTPESRIRQTRTALGILPGFGEVDTCAGEFQAKTPYRYSSYGLERKSVTPQKEAVVILGSGPNRIGQGLEFDYCCVHASKAAQDMGFDSVMINYNPETVSTDYDVSTRLYFEPLTFEKVLDTLSQEKVRGVVVQFGGQTPLRLAAQLEAAGIPVLGTSVDSIDLAEDRQRFDHLLSQCREMGHPDLQQPASRTVRTREEALAAAVEIGFPLMLRPSYVLGGRGMRMVDSPSLLEETIADAIAISDDKPLLMDRFLEGAVEVDIDALCDGTKTLIGGIMEHIEEAGIHSGDSACSIPCFTLSDSIQQRLRAATRVLAQALKVRGLINLQFAVQGQSIFVLEVNPRASRTVPFLSKAVGVPLARIATQIALGASLESLGFTKDFDADLGMFHVKMPVFPFHKFPGVDVRLGPEMKSTGESMGRGQTFPHAYRRAMEGAGIRIPTQGTVLVSVEDKSKNTDFAQLCSLLLEKGFDLDATEGTHRFLSGKGLPCSKVAKIGDGTASNNCLARLKSGAYSLVINTTSGEKSVSDGYGIRRTALEKKIPYCTLLTTARAFIQAIPPRVTASPVPAAERSADRRRVEAFSGAIGEIPVPVRAKTSNLTGPSQKKT